MAAAVLDPVAAVRRFNRFYTRRIGVLDEGHLGEPYVLAETRVLYEIAHAEPVTPKSVIAATGLDAGYLSRILKRFDREGLIARRASAADRRSVTLGLTPAGRAVFERLQRRTVGQVEALIGGLTGAQRTRLTGAMAEVQDLLAGEAETAPITLRPHRVGDMGWVIWRHAALYAREYGWDERFEALVAGIAADFIKDFDPARERCWIAERVGDTVGSVFLVKGEGDVARLRLLLIEPSARGQGLGRRLVEECIGFARAAEYREVTLWTQSILTAARSIYAACGFELVDSRPHREIGVDLVGETWRLAL
jgi:DNA-binding MarR family transcriptional regulator/GNAT superfamily N-acetyltransferase